MGFVTGTVVAATAAAHAARQQHRAQEQGADLLRMQASFASGGEQALKREVERIEAKHKDRAEREARAAARNPNRPDKFDFHWHAAMCAAESARLQGKAPAFDLPWEPAFGVADP